MPRPSGTWYVPKAINDVDRILDALVAVQDLDGEIWTHDSQTNLMEKIVSVRNYGGTPSPMAGRNWMATFQFFGFAFVERGESGKTIKITPAGKSIGHSDPHQLVRTQLLKLQFPNPYQSRYLPKDIAMFPYWTVLKIVKEVDYLIMNEISNYVLWIKNHDEIQTNVDEIQKNRSKKQSKKVDRDLLDDYATRIRLYFGYTDLLVDSGDKLEMNNSQSKLIEKILQKESIVNMEFNDNSSWNNWFQHYGSIKKPHRTITGRMSKDDRIAIKIDEYVKDSIASTKKSIKISAIEKNVRTKIEQIQNIIQKDKYIQKYPIFKDLEIRGNNIVIQKTEKPKTTKKKTIKIKPILKPYKQIILHSTYSDNYQAFEDDVAKIFVALQFDVDQLGVHAKGKRDVADCIIKTRPVKHSKEKPWAILIDAKSRAGSFSLGSTSRRAVLDYAENFIEDNTTHFLQGILFVSSKFSGNIKRQCGTVVKEFRKKNPNRMIFCSCITAKSLLYLLEKFLTLPGTVSPEKILELIELNKEITNVEIDDVIK